MKGHVENGITEMIEMTPDGRWVIRVEVEDGMIFITIDEADE